MRKFFPSLLLITLTGCTWVELTDEGKAVQVADSAPATCTEIGTASATIKADVATIDRNRDKVATELETLARNHAAGMGGDVIVAAGPVSEDGKRDYTVYDCP